MTDTIYARDLDGTGSMHICSDGDEGSIAYTRKDIADKRIAALADKNIELEGVIARQASRYVEELATARNEALELGEKRK